MSEILIILLIVLILLVLDQLDLFKSIRCIVIWGIMSLMYFLFTFALKVFVARTIIISHVYFILLVISIVWTLLCGGQTQLSRLNDKLEEKAIKSRENQVRKNR